MTSDSFARDLATRFNFDVVADDNSGETSAIEMATAVCRERGAKSTLVVPADIPLIDSCGTAEDRGLRSCGRRRAGAGCGRTRHECSLAISWRFVSAALRQRQLLAAPGRGEGNRPALRCARTAGNCARCRSSRRSSRTGRCQRRTAIAETGAQLEPQQPESGLAWQVQHGAEQRVSARLGKFASFRSPSAEKSAPENRSRAAL